MSSTPVKDFLVTVLPRHPKIHHDFSSLVLASSPYGD